MRIDWLALYQKSLLGGLGGLFGWSLAGLFGFSTGNVYADALIRGALIGPCIGAACGAWDGLFRNRSANRLIVGIGLGAAIGLIAGVVGLPAGQVLNDIAVSLGIFSRFGGELIPRSAGWAVFGAIIGLNEGIARRAKFQLFAGAFGGFLGGLFGGSSFGWLSAQTERFLSRELALSFSLAVGLVLLGLFVGAFMGLVENLMRSAWLVFTSGRLEGQSRTLDTSKSEITLGRSDGADICLLADAKIAARHAAIVGEGGDFYILAIDGPVQHGHGPKLASITKQLLKSGDMIQIGSNRAQFYLGGDRA